MSRYWRGCATSVAKEGDESTVEGHAVFLRLEVHVTLHVVVALIHGGHLETRSCAPTDQVGHAAVGEGAAVIDVLGTCHLLGHTTTIGHRLQYRNRLFCRQMLLRTDPAVVRSVKGALIRINNFLKKLNLIFCLLPLELGFTDGEELLPLISTRSWVATNFLSVTSMNFMGSAGI